MTPPDITTSKITARPIVKWVGGKSQLETQILKRIDRMHPDEIDVYYELFAGGLAVFFALQRIGKIRVAEISDTNPHLIALYGAVKDSPKRLIDETRQLLKLGTSEKAYYRVRAMRPRAETTRGARLLYLNRTCFNGLYRVNRKGEFNVPYGRYKNPKVLDEDAIWAAHEAFRYVRFYEGSAFGGIESLLETHIYDSHGAARFVYLDPPYWPTRETASFTSYTPGGFSFLDQALLAEAMRRLADVEIPALLSNADLPATRDLYRGLKLSRVSARRNINSKGNRRGPVSELLVEARYLKGKP